MERLLAARPLIRDLAREACTSQAPLGGRRQRQQPHRRRGDPVKLSELCYKAIACDTTEDKKHIDLSSEPLTLVCAAGLAGSVADDAAKEVAIFRAHKVPRS